MDFIELAKRRCSVRSFEPAKVEEEKLLQILEAGRIAPTAANRQPQSFLVINSEEGFERLKTIGFNTSAPLVIIICGDHENVWVREIDNKSMLDVDISIATDHMMLAAEDAGLSSCWLGWFDQKVIKDAFKIPDNIEPVSILIIGYAKESEKKSPNRHGEDRKPLSEFVHYNIY